MFPNFGVKIKSTVKFEYNELGSNEQIFHSQITIYHTNLPGYNEPRLLRTNFSPEQFVITEFDCKSEHRGSKAQNKALF